jgi:uncharacterized protein YcaQ
VLLPAHYLVLFSRLGPYPRSRMNELVYQGREFIEHWAHEACIVPVELWPLLEYRRQEFKPWSNSPIMKLPNHKQYLALAIEQVRSQGPITANHLPPVPRPAGKPGDWKRSVPRWALEYHFGNGDVSVTDRLPNFQRRYDLSEKIVDEPHFSTSVSKTEAQRELLYRAAGAFGVATLKDLADYYRMSTREAAPLVADLVSANKLCEVNVESWNDKAFMRPDVRLPRSISARALLSPFDPVVWFRPRALRLFDFHYRIEIYVPAARRKYGYYVLPFRLGDQIVARVDLKADRKNSNMLVLAVHEENLVERTICLEALALELQALQQWLCLDAVTVTRHNAASRQLAAVLRT